MLCVQGDTVDAINPSVELTEPDRIDRLRLIRSDDVGPRGVMAQTSQRERNAPLDGESSIFRIAQPRGTLA